MSIVSSLEPEHVPRKKNKLGSCVPVCGNKHTHSSKKDTALLLPVSTTCISSQARPSHKCPALQRKVSYGEISAEEVDKIVAQSDVDDAELSAASLCHCGHVLFVDNEASEASQHSDDLSADDEAAGTDCESDVRSSSSVEVIRVTTPLLSDNESASGESVVQAESPEALEEVEPSHPLRSKTKTVKGAYVDKLQGNRSKESDSDVYLEDLCQTPRIPSWAKGKTSLKTAASRCSSCSAKKEALSSNARLEEELSIDPVTDALTKTMSMSKAKKPSSAPKAVLSKDKYERKAPVANLCTPSKPTGEINALVAVSAMSVKRASSRKGATKALASAVEKNSEPLFLPLDSDGTGSAPPPDLHAQLGADFAALLGDDIRASSPEDSINTPVLRLPNEFVTYHPVIPISFTPKSFDPPRFHAFTDVAKLFHLESLMSLVEAFKFGSYGAFVNLAHVPHSVLSFEKRSLHFARSNAVCMTVGLITECMLFEPTTPGLFGAARVRCLRIMLFYQMFHRKSTVWALSIGDPCVESTYTSTQSTPAKGRRGSPMKKLLSAPALGPGGYSLTAWESYNKEPCLTPNILFVIVLGSAPKKDKLEVLGFLE
ncbi:hypothetical protein IW261DRAFT_1423820 [Armillaria novae-zelandiae]|uniref:Uncharacterized protein n=1 Tax=Armillaria novae-zelandiae TaxID=153914 RepID=A0AA39NWL0_9AGAR|nr:hypothetical protein IW261DRAFT_1423820 [Armillaria novae-zelandiae]